MADDSALIVVEIGVRRIGFDNVGLDNGAPFLLRRAELVLDVASFNCGWRRNIAEED